MVQFARPICSRRERSKLRFSSSFPSYRLSSSLEVLEDVPKIAGTKEARDCGPGCTLRFSGRESKGCPISIRKMLVVAWRGRMFDVSTSISHDMVHAWPSTISGVQPSNSQWPQLLWEKWYRYHGSHQVESKGTVFHSGVEAWSSGARGGRGGGGGALLRQALQTILKRRNGLPGGKRQGKKKMY